MAVQKSRVPRSRRGMRRAHDHLTLSALSLDQMTGEIHRRHHVTPNGFYRGKQVMKVKSESSTGLTENDE